MKLLAFLVCVTLVSVAQPKSSLQITVTALKDVKAEVEVPFEIALKDAKGAPVSGADVRVIATMVDMDHGEFKYQAKSSRPGVYQFTPRFMMGGTWNLAIKAQKGADSQSLNKRFEVKD